MNMKKTSGIFMVFLLLAGLLCSCTKELPKTLKPKTTVIEGNLGKHFEVVDQEYKFPDYSSGMSVELKRISAEYDYTSTEARKEVGMKAGVGIEVYDKDGKVLASKKAKLEPVTPLEWGSVFPTKEGETCTKTIYLPDYPDAYYGAETFKLTMIYNEMAE